MKKIYLAAPFFNENEIARVDKVKEILRNKGLEVFVPMEHQNPELEFGSMEWRKATFKNDVDHIDWADLVVAIIANGNYDDSGTAWELGYAYATNKPVILVNPTGETINLMIADSLHALIQSYAGLENYDFNTLERKEYTKYVW